MASRTVTVNAHQKYFFQNSIIIKSVQRRRLAVHIIFGFNFFVSHFFALNNAFQNFNFKWKCSRWVKNFNKQIGLRYTDSVLPPYDFLQRWTKIFIRLWFKGRLILLNTNTGAATMQAVEQSLLAGKMFARMLTESI